MSSTEGGMIYALGVIGALVYYIQHSTNVADGLIGIFKALFWPGFLIYKVLDLLKM